jgi:signal transduction histidine kinase/CheY-like chemotaxis protein
MTASPAGYSAPRGVRRLARALLQDPFVQLQLATTAAVSLPYWLPILTRDQLVYFSRVWLCLPLMVWPTIGCVWNLDELAPEERSAWRTMAAGFACWLIALAVVAFWPADHWNPVENATEAVLYMAYYLFMILAFSAMPLDGIREAESALERRLARLGLIIFVTGWVLYIVVLPGILESAFSGEVIVDSPMSLVLGLAVITQAAFRWHRSASPRSRAIAAAMMLASLALLGTDMLNLLGVMSVVDFGDGRWTDGFWMMPSLAMVLMVRLRHHSFPPLRPAGAEAPTSEERTPTALGIYLMVGSLSFLLVDAILRVAGFIGLSRRPATVAAELTLIAASVSLMVLAAISHWLLNERSARLRAERRQMQARLDQSNKMEALGRLAGGIAHDFNNLLTVVGGSNEMMQLSTPADSPLRELMRLNREAVDRATALTRQLLVFSRRQVVESAIVDVHEVIVRMSEMLSRIIGETIRIEVTREMTVPQIRINPAQLEQVVLNLVVNARDAMPAGGTITISSRRLETTTAYPVDSGVLSPGTYVAVSVADTGLGISDAVRPHVFEPFFTTKSSDGSRGVGLATAYGIVAQHGGAFALESAPGEGTTFVFYLPAVSAEPERPRAAAVAPMHTGSETILLAEDDDSVRAMTQAMLIAQGYTVLEASRPSVAKTCCQRHAGPIHLLLADVIMPEQTGPELAREIVAARPGIRVLLMSGYTGDRVGEDDRESIASHFIPKPFSVTELAAKVREVLDAT